MYFIADVAQNLTLRPAYFNHRTVMIAKQGGYLFHLFHGLLQLKYAYKDANKRPSLRAQGNVAFALGEAAEPSRFVLPGQPTERRDRLSGSTLSGLDRYPSWR